MRQCHVLLAATLGACGLAWGETSSFETGTEGWTPYPGAAKWVALDTAVSHTGKGALRVDDTSEWAYVGVSRVIAAKPSTPYRISAWAKTEAATGPACIFISELASEGRRTRMVKFHVLMVEQPRDWQRFEKEFTTTAETARLKVELCPVGFGIMHTGTAWFDDVGVAEAK